MLTLRDPCEGSTEGRVDLLPSVAKGRPKVVVVPSKDGSTEGKSGANLGWVD